jgi:hypothetical protein
MGTFTINPITGEFDISGGGGTTIMGTDTQVLFFDGNDNPAGDAELTWDKTTNVLGIKGDIQFAADSGPTEWNIRTANQSNTDKDSNGLFISTGNGNGTGNGSLLSFEGGDGGLSNGAGGGVGLSAGDGNGFGNGGQISLETGFGGAGGGDGGDLNIITNNGFAGGAGGDILVQSGSGGGSGRGGNFVFTAGSSELGNGGSFDLFAGAAGTAGGDALQGGTISFYGGSANDGDETNGIGGDIVFYPGQGQATDGKYKIISPANNIAGILDFDSLATTDKTFTFPNASGTIMLLPAVPADYTVTNGTTDRTFNADATSIDELADVLATLISDLTSAGLLQ